MSPAKIIDRIAKLLKLAEGKGTTPAEAATAAAQANRLMLKHNINQATVDGVDLDPSMLEAIERGVLWEGGRIVSWRMELACGVARLNQCRVLIHAATRPTHARPERRAHLSIIGRPSNSAVVSYLFTFLAREIDRLAKAADHGWESARSFRNSFRVGAVRTVLTRLSEDRDEQRREARFAKQSAALVLVDKHDTDVAAYTKRHASSGTYHGGAGSSSAGAKAGRSAGERIAIRSGLGAAAKKVRRLK